MSKPRSKHVKPYTKEEAEAFHEKALVTSMLMGEGQPIRCSCCGGRRLHRSIFGHRFCPQCMGTGYDIMGPKTSEAMGFTEKCNTIRQGKNK